MKADALALIIDNEHLENISKICTIFNNYYNKLAEFRDKYFIDEHSCFSSSFLEEMNWYLFKNLPELKSKGFKIFNKNIYLSMKFDEFDKVHVDTKNVDFCIGKETILKINDSYEITIRKPIVCVEVKTYTDATMFGEIKSSSQAIRSGTPTARTYVLMGYNSIASKHKVNAKYDTALTEMFVLREKEGKEINSDALKLYWEEISKVIADYGVTKDIKVPGRLLNQ